MASPHTILINEIIAEFGALPDMRVWPNVSSEVWVGKYVGRTRNGDTVLREARSIKAGLCKGSSDIIGIAPGGLFLAIEGKTGRAVARTNQRVFIKLVNDLGGLATVARSPEDVAKLLRRTQP